MGRDLVFPPFARARPFRPFARETKPRARRFKFFICTEELESWSVASKMLISLRYGNHGRVEGALGWIIGKYAPDRPRGLGGPPAKSCLPPEVSPQFRPGEQGQG